MSITNHQEVIYDKDGEKYKNMWEEFIYGLAHINIGSYQNPCDKKKTDLECINKIVKDIKQKYQGVKK